MYCTEENAAEDKVTASVNSRGTERANAAHETIISITIQLKQLELLAAEIEQSAARSSLLAADALTAADDAQISPDVVQPSHQVNRHFYCVPGQQC